MSEELISIVTTLYNYKRYIGELAESILTQSHKNWEWIIVDDTSTDNPMEVLKDYLKCNRNIIYIRLSHNQGYSVAKNMGITQTKGDYIVMIDADDMLTPKSLELRKKALDANPESLWCHGEVLVYDKGEPYKERSRVWKRNFRKKLVSQGWDLKKTYHHRLIHAKSVMVRSELHKIIGLYDETLRFSSDNEMWRRIIRFSHIPCHIEDFVAIYRVHPLRMAQSSYKKRLGPGVKKKIIADVEKRFQEGITPENTRIWE